MIVVRARRVLGIAFGVSSGSSGSSGRMLRVGLRIMLGMLRILRIQTKRLTIRCHAIIINRSRILQHTILWNFPGVSRTESAY